MIDPFNTDNKELHTNTGISSNVAILSRVLESKDNNFILIIAIGFILTVSIFMFIYNIFPQLSPNNKTTTIVINTTKAQIKNFTPVDTKSVDTHYNIDDKETDLSTVNF